MKKFAFFLFAALALCASNLFSLDVPELTGPVMDTAGLMSQSRRQELEEYLLQVDQNSTAQIAVLTVQSLEGESLEEYAIKVAREWELGESENNKGVLLLVAYKERKIRIEVGYGAEADLTDAKCGMIIRNVIAPEFQKDNYSGGIVQGAKAIAGVVARDAEGKKIDIDDDDDDTFAAIVMLIFWALWFIMFSGGLATKFSALSWLPWASWFIRHQKKGGGSDDFFFGGSGFGGGSSGGFGGGGFSGGGGGFGGGGASGGW